MLSEIKILRFKYYKYILKYKVYLKYLEWIFIIEFDLYNCIVY